MNHPIRSVVVIAVLAGLGLGCGTDTPLLLAPDRNPAGIPHRPTDLPGSRRAVPDQVVVTLALGVTPSTINAQFGTQTLGSVPAIRVYLFQAPAATPILDLLVLLRQFPGVLAADMNWLLQAPESEQRSLAFNEGMYSHDDYLDQGFMERIQGPPAHAISQGTNVLVAVLDTGIDLDHPDLIGRIQTGGYDFVANDEIPDDEANGLDEDNDGVADESAGHGTHVAGLVHLAAPAAGLLPVRVLDSEGWGDSFSIIKGIVHATNAGSKVINMSFGMDGDQPQLRKAVKFAAQNGIVMVASAGNSGRNLPDHYPAAYPEVIAVAATDSEDRLASFSNYGRHIDLCAPGVGIASTFIGGTYAAWSGTSMAAPLVSGAAALIVSMHEGGSPASSGKALYVGANGVEPMNSDYPGMVGAGRVNLYGGLQAWPVVQN